MDAVIVAGGRVNPELLKQELEHKERPYLIAADRGLSVLREMDVLPDYIIGDFDSADTETYEYAVYISEEHQIPLRKLNPVKDDTDTEAALNVAFEKTDGAIRIYGGTGTRLDHVMANISILFQGLTRDRKTYLIDETNRIQVMDAAHPVTIYRDEQYGKYLSLFPHGGVAEGVSIRGVYYPLKDQTLAIDSSLGTSNEITGEKAEISVRVGKLIVMETTD